METGLPILSGAGVWLVKDSEFMKSLMTVVLVALALTSGISDVRGQDEDPFADPRRPKLLKRNKADQGNPFVDDAKHKDPFAGGPGTDDPFADSPASDDPFGGSSSKQSKPAGIEVVDDPMADVTLDLDYDGWARLLVSDDTSVIMQRVGETAKVRAQREHINARLSTKVNLEFVDTPLSDVASFIQQALNISVTLDTRRLDEIGIGSDTPVTVNYQGVSCRSALRMILAENDLTFVVEPELVRITSYEALESDLISVVYTVPSLLGVDRHLVAVDQTGFGQDADELIEAITRHISPESWEEVGGPGSISFTSNTLVVSQTPEITERIYDFLRTLSSQQLHADISGGFGGSFVTRLYRINILGKMSASKGRLAIEQAKAGIVSTGDTFSTGNMNRTRPASLTYSVTSYGTQASMTMRELVRVIKQKIGPGTWTGRYRNTIQIVGGGLVIDAEATVHRQIESLLRSAGLLNHPTPTNGGMIGPTFGGGSGHWGIQGGVPSGSQPTNPPPSQGFQE